MPQHSSPLLPPRTWASLHLPDWWPSFLQGSYQYLWEGLPDIKVKLFDNFSNFPGLCVCKSKISNAMWEQITVQSEKGFLTKYCWTQSSKKKRTLPTFNSLCLLLADVVHIHLCQWPEKVGFGHHALSWFPWNLTDSSHDHNTFTYCLHCLWRLGKWPGQKYLQMTSTQIFTNDLYTNIHEWHLLHNLLYLYSLKVIA